MTHTQHHWRATNKVFALVCECGLVYHEWLQIEIEKLRSAAAAPLAPTGPSEETIALRVQLEETQREVTTLRTQLDGVKSELEIQAAEVTDLLTRS
jgi:hypothetical protein